MKIVVAPSILAGNLIDLRSSVEKVIESGARWLHIDIMDGHFVPNLTFGPQTVQALTVYCQNRLQQPKIEESITFSEDLSKFSKKNDGKLLFDVHCMLMYPEHFVESFAQSGADLISIHVELKSPIEKTLHLIKQMGKQVGLAINPETPIEAVFPFLDFVDLVLIMSVNPGFCGQKFIESSLGKIEILRKRCPSINIEVDGGINLEYAQLCGRSGANIVVTGSSFFTASDAHEFVQKIEHE